MSHKVKNELPMSGKKFKIVNEMFKKKCVGGNKVLDMEPQNINTLASVCATVAMATHPVAEPQSREKGMEGSERK